MKKTKEKKPVKDTKKKKPVEQVKEVDRTDHGLDYEDLILARQEEGYFYY